MVRDKTNFFSKLIFCVSTVFTLQVSHLVAARHGGGGGRAVAHARVSSRGSSRSFARSRGGGWRGDHGYQRHDWGHRRGWGWSYGWWAWDPFWAGATVALTLSLLSRDYTLGNECLLYNDFDDPVYGAYYVYGGNGWQCMTSPFLLGAHQYYRSSIPSWGGRRVRLLVARDRNLPPVIVGRGLPRTYLAFEAGALLGRGGAFRIRGRWR